MQNFIYLSRYAGMREDLVQAGGGNSSVKLAPDRMLIKASGFQLAELTETVGWCTVDPSGIVDFFSKDRPAVTKEAEQELLRGCLVTGPDGESVPQQAAARPPARPSIEVFLHSVTQKYTLHTHPTVVNVLASTDSGWAALRPLFPDALFVGYATPGIRLAAEYFGAYRAFGKMPDTIFLKNHGLVVSGGTAGFVKDRTEEVLHTIEDYLGLDMTCHHAATRIYDATRNVPGLEDRIAYLSRHADVQEGIRAFGPALWDWQFCPDCIVYCGKGPLALGESFSETDFTAHIEKQGAPVVLSHGGNVYILAGSVKKAKDTESVLAFSARVALANRARKLPMGLLPGAEQDFLLNWDAEKYRRNMK